MAERQGRNVMVSTFRVPDEYERARLEAERRAALAQMLEAQAYEPLDIRQPAPIAPSQGLAKVLKSYLGAYEKRKAREAEEKAKGEEIETASQIMGRLTGRELPEFEPDEAKRAANQAAEAQRIADMRAETEASIARQRETGQLEEITLPPSLRYIRDPEEALRLADTPAGQAALKNRPVMAAKLAELLKTPEKPTTKTMEVGGQLVNVTEGVATPVKTAEGTPFTVAVTPSIGAPGFENFTTESLRKYQQTGNPMDLVEKEKPPKPVDEAAADNRRFRQEDTLRSNFENRVKPYVEEIDATSKILDVAASIPPGMRPDATTQQAFVILLNKFLDPGSVVREGEFARVLEAQGAFRQAKMLKDRISKGDILDEQSINQIVNLAKTYQNIANTKISRVANEVASVARRRNLDVESIILNPAYLTPQSAPTPTETPAVNAPPAGTVNRANVIVRGGN